MTQSPLFYVTAYFDHLNGVTPETPVLFPMHTDKEKRSSPYFRTPHLRNGAVPGVAAQPLDPVFEGWEHWVCNWTDADMAAMNIVPQFHAEDSFADQWPDVWNISALLVNAKARAAFETHAPDAFLFFPVEIFSRTTGEPVGDARWRCVPRHWIQVTGEKMPLPECDFDPTTYAPLFRMAQGSPQITAFLHDLGCFSAVGGGRPVYSPALFQKLISEGLSGLTEKTSKSITFHELREVITHVWTTS